MTGVAHHPGRRRVVGRRRIGGGGHDVEQFDEGHHERHRLIGGEVGAVAGDDEPLACIEECVEQHLTGVVARVALPDARVQTEDVVTVERPTPQCAVVQTEQADDTRGHAVLGHE